MEHFLYKITAPVVTGLSPVVWKRVPARVVLCMESRKTRRKQLTENNSSKILGGKLVEKQLAENSPAKNSSQE